jgi:hypothetical protein
MVRHGVQVLFEDIQVDHHAGSREIFLVKVFEISAHDARFDLVVPGGAGKRA